MLKSQLLTGIALWSLLAPQLSSASNESSSSEKVIYAKLPDELTVFPGEQADDVLLKLSGIFTNGCYNKDTVIAQVKDGRVLIENLVSFTPQELCTMALKPYSQQVPLINLKSGDYEVDAKDRDGNYTNIGSFEVP